MKKNPSNHIQMTKKPLLVRPNLAYNLFGLRVRGQTILVLVDWSFVSSVFPTSRMSYSALSSVTKENQ